MGTANFHMLMLVIGLGEVGNALETILKEKYTVSIIAKPGDKVQGTFDVLHICFSWSATFTQSAREYREQYLKPGGLMIIHSTVPVGTSAACDAVHSPIRGVHPDLVSGIKMFVKYFGGPRAEEAANMFTALGIKTKTTPLAKNTEALKLWDTTYYAWNIVFMKELREWCEVQDIEFDLVYTDGNRTYNEGYTTVGKPEVVRPVLKYQPGKIGGHCLIPNCELLDGEIANFILRKNDSY